MSSNLIQTAEEGTNRMRTLLHSFNGVRHKSGQDYKTLYKARIDYDKLHRNAQNTCNDLARLEIDARRGRKKVMQQLRKQKELTELIEHLEKCAFIIF